MKNKVVLGAKKILFRLHLGIIWKLLDDIKFALETKKLQRKARSEKGDNQLKKELAIFFKGQEAYQPLLNSDLKDIPFSRMADSRFETIKRNLFVSKGTLLDIGANLGYFCHKFEDEGFDCYALEENRMLCYFMEKLKKAEGKHFKIIPQSIFEYKGDDFIVYDVVLALSVFHHFLKSEEAYFNLTKVLKRIKAKEFFFEPHLARELESKPFYKNYTPEQFVEFIIKNSWFKKSELLGQSPEGRPIYKLTP